MHKFVIPATPGLANAIRRSLLDVKSWAPKEVVFTKNTSCFVCEFLSHRIGLIPFRKLGGEKEMKLSRIGPCSVTAADLTGPDFEPIYPNIIIAELTEGDELDITVRFEAGTGGKHARFSPCAAIGMCKLDASHHRVQFELHDDSASGKQFMLSAIQNLEDRVDRALLCLAKQPDPPPKSRC